MEDRIEERVIIRAAQDQVWHLVARPGWWLPGSSAAPARGPGRVAVTYRGDERPYVIDIVRVEPQHYASFRWASAFGGAAPAPGKATLVEFYLRPVGNEVGVTVVESGFASLDLPEALCESEWTGSKGGWRYELAELRTRAEVGRLSPGRASRAHRGTRHPEPATDDRQEAYSPPDGPPFPETWPKVTGGAVAPARNEGYVRLRRPGSDNRTVTEVVNLNDPHRVGLRSALEEAVSSPAGRRGVRCCSPSVRGSRSPSNPH